MNYFSGDVFLETLAHAFFPGHTAAPGYFQVEGRVYRLLVIDGSRPITQWSFLDLLEPVEPVPPGITVHPVHYLPRALRAIRSLEAWRAESPGPEWEPCPFVDWRLFPSWEAYAAARGRCGHDPDSRRRRRVLEKMLGPLAFRAEDARPEVLATCMRWKSARYRATGRVDAFADARYVRFYEMLHARGGLATSSLSAGGRLVAVHVGMRQGPRRMSWMPAYDEAYARAAPGRLLLEALLEHSYRSGDAEFDFLLGDEAYKFEYATHVRLAGPVGDKPLALRVEELARRHVRRALRYVPPWVETRAREWRLRRMDS